MGRQLKNIRRDMRHPTKKLGFTTVAVLVLTFSVRTNAAVDAAGADLASQWLTTLLEAQTQAVSLDPNSEAFTAAAEQLSVRGEREFPVPWDWCLQDAGPDFRPWLSASAAAPVARNAAAKALAELGAAGRDLQHEFDRLASQPAPVESRQWLELYFRAAEQRRQGRLGACVSSTRNGSSRSTASWAARTMPTPRASPTRRTSGNLSRGPRCAGSSLMALRLVCTHSSRTPTA